MKYEVLVREFTYRSEGVSLTENTPVEYEAERVVTLDGVLQGFDKDNELLWAFPPGEWFGVTKKGLVGWEDAPDAVPRNAESVAISLRLPKKMLDILREFARREGKGIGYQALLKRWLDDRIRKEAAEGPTMTRM